MNKALFRLAAAAIFAGIALVSTAAAQDFQKSYQIGAGGEVRIGTVSGDVTVEGYDGSAVVVTGFKKGRDLDMVDIEDRSTGSNIDVSVRYPKNCNCDVSVRFEVKVPRSVAYDFDRISSVSGNVEIRNIMGKINASSVSGEVKVRNVAGSVSASSVSGNVEVEIDRLDGTEGMKFSSVSGDVDVRLPSSLGADISMSSFSGAVRTDFPIEVRQERYGSRNSARGKVGDGSRSLRISSVSGSLSLTYSGR
jgi:DUF4097 and DUF4098 domain-containing protein YvlB